METFNKTLGTRHLQMFMLFLANFICYASRTNLNIALIAMTDKNNEQYFDIDLKIQSTLQSSLFWGYFVAIFPAGVITTRYGGRPFLILCLFVNSAASIALPFTRFLGPNGWKMIYVCRVIQGMFQAFLAPSYNTLMSKWVPQEERSRLGSFTFSGIHLGNAFQPLMSGYLADRWGWPSIFYLYAILGLCWLVLYVFVGAESPEESKIISKEERIYIQTSLNYSGSNKKPQVPWMALITSMPFIATIVAFCGFKWGYFTLMTQIPTYLKQIHNMNLRENGALSSLPYVALFATAYPLGYFADFILKKKWLQLTAIRKIFTSIGFLGPAAWLVALAQATPHDTTLAVVFLTLAITSSSGAYSGFIMNHLDMAPNFPGVMNGISNVFASVATIAAPIAAGFMLGDGTDIGRWQTVFYVAAGMYVATCTFYVVFGDCRRQPWNEPGYKKRLSCS